MFPKMQQIILCNLMHAAVLRSLTQGKTESNSGSNQFYADMI